MRRYVLDPDDDLPVIRQLYRDGWSATRIGRRFGVCREAIQQALYGKTYRNHPDPCGRAGFPGQVRGQRCHQSKMTEVEVREARRRHEAGETVASLARDYHLSHTAMDAIIRHATWKHVTD